MSLRLPEDVKDRSKKGSFGGYGFGGGGSYHHTPCKHDGTKVVAEIDGKKLFGGEKSELKWLDPNKWDLVIDLASNFGYQASYVRDCTTPKWKKKVDKYMPKWKESEHLALNWPDFGIIDLPIEFWLDLWESLPKRTMACCMGGHGRTGTVLVALLIASGMSYYEALKLVRKEHCEKAVESEKQCSYLHRIYVDRLKKEGKQSTTEYDFAVKNPPKKEDGSKESKVTVVSSGSTGNTSYNSGSYGHKFEPRMRLMPDGTIEKEFCNDPKCFDVECYKVSHYSWEKLDLEKDDLYAAAGK